MTIIQFQSPVSVSEAIAQAMPYQATKVELFADLKDANRDWATARVPTHRAVVRSDTGGIIGVVGKDYEVVQASKAFEPAQSLIDAGVATVARAGEYEGGRVQFLELALRTDRPIEVAVGDMMRQTMTFTNSHNGSSSLRIIYQLWRLICGNGMQRPETSNLFRGRHTSGVYVQLDRARAEIAQRFAAVESEVELFRRLLGKRLSDKNLVRYVRETLVEGAGNDPDVKVRNVDRIVELAHTAPGATPGTLYGGLNAITYWATHERGRTADARATGLLFGQSGALLQRATDVAVRYAEKLPDAATMGYMAAQSVATASAELSLLLGKPSAIV
jgi:phage/plasmid-like protein (TIGR03299 family)